MVKFFVDSIPDGTVHNEPPFMEKVKRFFTELWVIIVMLWVDKHYKWIIKQQKLLTLFNTSSFKTLFGENMTKGGNNYTRDYRGGGGGGGSGPGGPRGGSGWVDLKWAVLCCSETDMRLTFALFRSSPRPPQRRVGRIAGMSDIPCPPSGGWG